MRTFTILASLLALTACGDKDDEDSGGSISGSGVEWCTDYFNALEGCYQEAGLPVSYELDTLCGFYDGLDQRWVYDQMYCYIDVIEAGDCSSEEGLDDINTALTSCEP